MSNYLASRIDKSRFTKVKVRRKKLQRMKYVIGFDSEADTSSDGRPMLFQFSLPNTTEEQCLTMVVPETKHAGLGIFLDFLDTFCSSQGVEYLIYGWNISYELTQLFHDLSKDLKNRSEFTLTNIHRGFAKKYEWSVEVLNGKRPMVVFRKGRQIKVTLLDGTAFYKISLDSAAKMLMLGQKYEMKTLNRTMFTRKDLTDEDFLRYARRDAFITRKIGEYIQHQHWMYQIPTTISAPHFAATVFKTQFLKESIQLPSRDIEQGGLYSYHGGKNGFYLDGPAEFQTIYQYDITSAYPEAMKQLPDIELADWSHARKYFPNEHAIYKVSLDYDSCSFKPLQNHDGSRTLPGIVTDIWTTGYELDEIVARNEARIISCVGYVYRGPRGGALVEFVDRFFEIKRNSSGPERETAKLLLNSLYGKFFQKQALGSVGTYDIDNDTWVQTDPTEEYDYEAGGLYNPPVASLITGFVRAKIHKLEHKYESVMTSTDGLFGITAPDVADIGTNLGQLTVTQGKLRIWRERLYIFDGKDGKRKFALHGFHSDVTQLEDIPLARGDYSYIGKQMITLKMSTRRQRGVLYSPGQFIGEIYKLRV